MNTKKNIFKNINIIDFGFKFLENNETRTNDSEKGTNSLKTKFCHNIIKFGKCTYNNCTFAHNMTEFSPECNFGNRCLYKNKGCAFLHPGKCLKDYCFENNIPYNHKLEVVKPFPVSDPVKSVPAPVSDPVKPKLVSDPAKSAPVSEPVKPKLVSDPVKPVDKKLAWNKLEGFPLSSILSEMHKEKITHIQEMINKQKILSVDISRDMPKELINLIIEKAYQTGRSHIKFNYI